MSVSGHIPSWAVSDEASSSGPKKSSGPGAQWQALNVNDNVIKSLMQRKFKSPTPIQRAAIPPALSSPPRDILGMARTGSGKTLAYLIPLLQRLGSTHVSITSPRALILCPSRELAVQIFSVGKDLARGMSKGKNKDGENLKWALIIGGEGLDEQFEKMSSSPDVIIATPGRFLHVAVEMRYDLRHLQMMIYDEADSRLPSTRQNLLFSATLPSSVAEFAKAGLINPLLIRLDSEDKISPDLEMRFLAIKPSEKDAALCLLIRDAAIVFVSTKHHVDYVSELLKTSGYRTSHIYSSLDQSARQQQLHHFRNHLSDILVVTDVAARGLDIPVMDHVINYDFPPGPRVFVHRVGRTARAGRKGNAWSLVTKDDWPYLFDLQTFLGSSRIGTEDQILRSLPEDDLGGMTEYILTSLNEMAPNLVAQRQVMRKGQAMYERSRGKANTTSYRTAKTFGKRLEDRQIRIKVDSSFIKADDEARVHDRTRLLSTVAAYTPPETIFEVGKRGDSAGATLMKSRRKVVAARKKSIQDERNEGESQDEEEDMAGSQSHPSKSFRDPAFYMDHARPGADSEQGYSLKSGASLPETMAAGTLEMTADEGAGVKAQKASQIRWDRKKRKFVNNGANPDGVKMVRSESGALLPASYSSGRFQEWKAKRRSTAKGEGRASHKGLMRSGESFAPSRSEQHPQLSKRHFRLREVARPEVC
ncbi:hypothetical protein IAU60_001399 [Kwoniella sp. DSM 27419]